MRRGDETVFHDASGSTHFKMLPTQGLVLKFSRTMDEVACTQETNFPATSRLGIGSLEPSGEIADFDMFGRLSVATRGSGTCINLERVFC